MHPNIKLNTRNVDLTQTLIANLILIIIQNYVTISFYLFLGKLNGPLLHKNAHFETNLLLSYCNPRWWFIVTR